VRVNNDPQSNGKLQCWPWIAVDDSGRIAIVYYDSRNTPSNSIIEAWVAASTDGGQTFTNAVLSTAQSPTNTPGTNVRFGDYIGIDFWGNHIVPVWTDERAGGNDQEIYTAVVVGVPTGGIMPLLNTIPEGYKLSQNYPNPFNPSTTINFEIPKSSHIILKVYDINGKEVETLYSGVVNGGEYSIKWDGSNYSSGIYFYKLETPNFVETRKMMLIK
jgi:hypothetical protein